MRIPKYFYNLSEAEQAKWFESAKEKKEAYDAKYKAENREKRIAQSAKYYAEIRSQKSAMKFFQMTQAISEIANINTKKK